MKQPHRRPRADRSSPSRGWPGVAGGFLLAIVHLTAACGQERAGADTAPPAAVAAEIRAAAAAYREALAKGDAEAIRAAWTAEGDIVDGWGNRLEPRSAAGDAASGPRPEFRMGESRLRLVTPDVALEDGAVDVMLPGTAAPIEGWFSALWVRRDGGWKLAGLRESERPLAGAGSMLADLDWMVGDWTLVGDGAERAGEPNAADMTVRWDAGRAFLIRDARIPVVAGGEQPPVLIEVHQRIGWDPLVKRIRSWSFASDGSRAEATWFRDGDSWIAQLTTIQADGRQRTAVHIYTYDGKERCVWRTLPEGLETDDGLPPRVTWIRKPPRPSGSDAK